MRLRYSLDVAEIACGNYVSQSQVDKNICELYIPFSYIDIKIFKNVSINMMNILHKIQLDNKKNVSIFSKFFFEQRCYTTHTENFICL